MRESNIRELMTISSKLEKAKSQGGHQYSHRPAPTTVEFDYVSASNEIGLETVEGYPVYHLYVRCKEVKNKGLPLDADPRQPDESNQVAAMKTTLEEEPSEFVKKNNGIVLLCDDAEITNDSVELRFEANEGICNGGHTYYTFYRAEKLPDEAIVHLETILLGDEEFDSQESRRKKITEIARARNNNNQLDQRSVADFLGDFDNFKDTLIDDRLIAWPEGDRHAYSDDINSVDFIRLIKTLDPNDYRHPLYNPGASTHKRIATSRKRILRQWADSVEDARHDPEQRQPLYYLVPVSNDLLYLRDLVSYGLSVNKWGVEIKNTNLWQEYIEQGKRDLVFRNFNESTGFNLPRTLEVLFIGLFRTNLYLSATIENEPNYVGWFSEHGPLWSNRGKFVVNEMSDMFQNVDSDPKQFIRLNGPFTLDLFKFMHGQDPPFPSRLYDIHDVLENGKHGRVYRQTDSNEGEYWLKRAEESTVSDELIPVDEIGPPNDVPLYSSTTVSSIYDYESPK